MCVRARDSIPSKVHNNVTSSFSTTAPAIRFLLDSIKEKGCRVPPDFIKCVRCGDKPTVAGAFSYAKGHEKVVICEEPCERNLARRTIVHELIHAYDVCRTHFDANSCEHRACTEVSQRLLL